MKSKIAIVRGKFLNQYEMQFYEPLVKEFDLTAFGSLRPYHDRFVFPVVKLPSPMDLPEFPYKMPIFNRLFTDAHYLYGLEEKLKGLDIVHSAETYYHYTQQALNAKKKGYVKKVIATALENIPFNNEGIWGRKAFKTRARKELDHIIALTNKTKEALLAEGADEKKITVISHFIDTKRFAPRPEVFKRRFKKRKKHFVIMYSGRLEEYKGVLDICAAAEILKRDPDLKKYILDFLFVGSGSVHVDHKVKSVSYSDMSKMYAEADIFIAPSKSQYGRDRKVTWEEQYNTALMEAQAAGLPIVTTRSGGIPENVGNAAVMVEPGNVNAIAQTLKEFILNPKKREEYAMRALKRARTVHDKMIGAKKLAQLYHELLA